MLPYTPAQACYQSALNAHNQRNNIEIYENILRAHDLQEAAQDESQLLLLCEE